MKRNLMYVAVLAAAIMVSCNGKNTAQNEANTDSTSVADTTASENLDLAAVAGTYEGTLPAADCPGIKTVLTINADSTYQLKQDYIDRKDGHDEASGVLQVLDNNVLMLVCPSSGDNIFYKMKNYSSIILIDSSKNEPKRKEAKHFVLRKKA